MFVSGITTLNLNHAGSILNLNGSTINITGPLGLGSNNISTTGSLIGAIVNSPSGVITTLQSTAFTSTNISISNNATIASVISNTYSFASGVVNFFSSGISTLNINHVSSILNLNGSAININGNLSLGSNNFITNGSVSSGSIINNLYSYSSAGVISFYNSLVSTINIGYSGSQINLNGPTTINSNLVLSNNFSITSAPCVSGYLVGSISMPVSTYTLAKFTNIDYATSSSYSTSTGIFTVQTGYAGYYLCMCNLNLQGTGIANSFAVMYLNNAYYKKGGQMGGSGANGSIVCVMIKLNVGDTISFYGYAASGSSMTIYDGGTARDSHFSITYLRS
jgi:hypothetical protein